MARTILCLGSVLGLLAVAAGTFGAHGLEGRANSEALHWFNTGQEYHMYHALAILGCGWLVGGGAPRRTMAAVWCFTIGVVIFSGSLYVMTLTGWRWLGMITPIGGVLFLVGWVMLLSVALSMSRGRGRVTENAETSV